MLRCLNYLNKKCICKNQRGKILLEYNYKEKWEQNSKIIPKCLNSEQNEYIHFLTKWGSFKYLCVPTYFSKNNVLNSHIPKPPQPQSFITFSYWEFKRGITPLFALSSTFSVKPVIVTCNKHCRYRDRALSQWQRRAGSEIGCSLGWMVVLQAPGKLLSQYHFQYVAFSEAKKR